MDEITKKQCILTEMKVIRDECKNFSEKMTELQSLVHCRKRFEAFQQVSKIEILVEELENHINSINRKYNVELNLETLNEIECLKPSLNLLKEDLRCYIR